MKVTSTDQARQVILDYTEAEGIEVLDTNFDVTEETNLLSGSTYFVTHSLCYSSQKWIAIAEPAELDSPDSSWDYPGMTCIRARYRIEQDLVSSLVENNCG